MVHEILNNILRIFIIDPQINVGLRLLSKADSLKTRNKIKKLIILSNFLTNFLIFFLKFLNSYSIFDFI